MALREAFMQKVITGTSTLSIQADANESLLVTDIQILAPNSNYATIRVDRATVGYWRIGGSLGSHLGMFAGRSQHAHDWVTSSTATGDQTVFGSLTNAGGTEVAAKMIGGLSASTTYRRVGALAQVPNPGRGTILDLLAARGLWKGYPIPTGRTMTITFTQQATTRVIITYQIYDAGDIKAEQENGPEGKVLLYCNYGNAGASINATGDTSLTVSVNPSEFPAFPFGDDVPSKYQMDILGLLASDFSPKENTGTNDTTTVALKLIRDRTVLFDKDRVGLRMESFAGANQGAMDFVGEGYGTIGNYSTIDYRDPLFFNPPLRFLEGQEFLIQWNTLKAGTGQNIAIDEHEVGVLMRLTKV